MLDGWWIIYELVVFYDLFRVVIIGLKLCIFYCFKVCIINVKEGKEYFFSLESKIFDMLELFGF